MDLNTRCPHCGTVFKVSLADLQLRKGYIRCLHCAQIFDGYAEVVSDDPGRAHGAGGSRAPAAAASPVAPPAAAAGGHHHAPIGGPAQPTDADTGGMLRFRISDVDPDRPAQAVRAPSGRRAEPHIGLHAAPGFGHSAPPMAHNTAQPTPRDTAQAEPFLLPRDLERPSEGGSAAPLLESESTAPGWWESVIQFFSGVVLTVLAILLVAQLAYVYRAQLARFVPAARPLLLQACVPLRCKVPYARDLSQISITGSALRAVDAPGASAGGAGKASGDEVPGAIATVPGAAGGQGRPQHFELQVSLRNSATLDQEWPDLVLDLKDGSGALQVRRNLAPHDYLGAAASGPFPAHSDVLVRVPLTLNGVQVNGYQLKPFFP